MQNRFEQVEELVIDVIEQQYKMASDNKSDNYGNTIRNCGRQLSNLIGIVLRNSYQQAGIPLYHINTLWVAVDFARVIGVLRVKNLYVVNKVLYFLFSIFIVFF